MRRIWLPALISVLLIGTTAVPAFAGKDLPFKAKTEIVNTVPATTCPTGYVGDDSTHIGTGTHLGRFVLFETLCLDFSDPPSVPFFVVGELVAANGDELYFDVDGTFDVVSNTISSTGWVFDGGTGRFENASGQADETLIRNPAGDLIGVTVAGTISFDASDRSNGRR